MGRQGNIHRVTGETEVRVAIGLDGSGQCYFGCLTEVRGVICWRSGKSLSNSRISSIEGDGVIAGLQQLAIVSSENM